mmetsp:Transcript_3582/g.22487  ORF Transcript_3582/g.22487 Transcript_3582/m.22487 type:complete len:278 (+) Transcript_3582:1419-2252(+)
MLLTYPSKVSEYASEHHCSATSISVSSTWHVKVMGSCMGCLSRFTQDTYSFSPPSKWNSSHSASLLPSGAPLNLMRAALLRKASSRMRIRRVSLSYLIPPLNTVSSARNLTSVPVRWACSFGRDKTCRSVTGLPFSYLCLCIIPSLQTTTSNASESAFTTDRPTPCSPPDTLYPLSSPPNFPPACSTVSTVSSADFFVELCCAVGMPRPSSDTRTQPPSCSSTCTCVACPACTSSTALSTSSYTRWCKPLGPVLPMYMPGRLRTGSKPSNTWICSAS